MSTLQRTLTYTLSSFILTVLLLAWFELRTTRAMLRRLSDVLSATLSDVMKGVNEASRSITRLERSNAELKSILAKAPGSRPDMAPSDGVEGSGQPFSLLESPDVSIGEDLPPLPPDISAESVVKHMKLEDFLKDQRFNATDHQVTPTEGFRIQSALTRGRAAMEAIDAEIRAEKMEAMDTLRAQGSYVEYAVGEPYIPLEKGVLTGAESAGPHRTRMFYFYPDEFPRMFELKQARRREAEHALRQALTLVVGREALTEHTGE